MEKPLVDHEEPPPYSLHASSQSVGLDRDSTESTNVDTVNNSAPDGVNRRVASAPEINVRSASSSTPGHHSHQYEEFFGGTIQCPTCRGVGRIPREMENEMVAIIPFTDQRLKPRRTMLYVVIAILACLAIGGLLLFFLLPRSVKLDSSQPTLTPRSIYINTTKQIVFLQIRNEYNISNQNFFPVDVVKLEVTVLFDTKVLGSSTNNTAIHVPMRSTRKHFVEVNVTFSGDEGYIAFYCSDSSKYGHTLLMPFDAEATTNYMGHTEEATLTTYQHVRCSKDALEER